MHNLELTNSSMQFSGIKRIMLFLQHSSLILLQTVFITPHGDSISFENESDLWISESQGTDEAPTFQRKRTATTCCLLTIPVGIWYFYLLDLAFPGEVSAASWWQQWSSGYLRGRPGLGSWLLDSVWSSSSCQRHLRCNPAGGSSLSASPILS